MVQVYSWWEEEFGNLGIGHTKALENFLKVGNLI